MTLTAGARDGEESLLESNLAIPVTGRTCRRTGTFFSARAVAFTTAFVPRHFYPGRGAEGGFFESEIQIVTKIRATLYAVAAAARSEDITEAEKISENVAEVGKNIWIETAKTARRRIADTSVTEPVILSSFLRIAQNGIGFGRFFK